MNNFAGLASAFGQMGGAGAAGAPSAAGGAGAAAGLLSGFMSMLGGAGGGAAPGASGGGGMPSWLTGAASGASMGMVAGPWGAAAGAAAGLLMAAFQDGGTPNGSTQFDGLHSPTLAQVPASSMKEPEATIISGYAVAGGISVEEVLLCMSQDAADNRQTVPYVMDAWRNGGRADLGNMRKYIASYNRQHSDIRIVEGTKGPVPAALGSAAYPLPPAGAMNGMVNGFGTTRPLPMGAAGFGVSDLSPYLNGAVQGGLNGAKGALLDLFSNSPTGRDMQNAGVQAWASRNTPYLVVGFGGVLYLAYKAFSKK